MGKLIAWILLGFSNFISTYKPFIKSGDKFKSSNLLADVYGVSPEVTYRKKKRNLSKSIWKTITLYCLIWDHPRAVLCINRSKKKT